MDRLAVACEEVARYKDRARKVAVLGEYFKTLNDADFSMAVQFLSTGPVTEVRHHHLLFGGGEKTRLTIGHAVLRQALESATDWDKETLSVCYAAVGDAGETIGLLLRGFTADEPLTLCEANRLYQEICEARTSNEKRELLAAVFKKYKPLTVKYFVKIIVRALRIGLTPGQLEQAVAAACGISSESIREANNRLGDLARVALAARRNELSAVEARLFHPMDFMLAKPLERLEDIAQAEDWSVEDKYDGLRSQVHFDNGRVRIYSRHMGEVTASFPDLVRAFASLPESASVEGEILAWRDGRPLSSNVLRERLARNSEVPVIFMAYDLLLHKGEVLFERPLEQRRRRLEDLFADYGLPLMLSKQYSIRSGGGLQTLLKAAAARGNHGLMLKRLASSYESGKRSGAWQKLKSSCGTLNVVITSAERGTGRQALSFSGYTLAVKNAGGFVNIGKAFSALTGTEVKELTRLLRAGAIEKFGKVTLVRPEIVLEVGFDGVQRSARRKSGYTLRSPRILRWRRDKTPEECDDLGRVEALYQASIE